jgi:hypothetical protein
MSALATIHVGLKQLGIEDEDARDLYERQTGKRSLRAMSGKEQESIIGELRRLGFTKSSTGTRKRLEGRFAKKLQALWIAAWNLGLVRDRRDEALVSFVRRQTGIDHVRFLRHPEDGAKAIEALKGWMEREAGVTWGRSNGYEFLKHDAGKVAWAQFGKLVPGATLMGNRLDFHRAVGKALGREVPLAGLGALTPEDWRTVMNAFGERIRKAQG